MGNPFEYDEATMLAALKSVFVPIHRAGWPFIALFVAIAVILGWGWAPLLVPGGLLAAWCVYFFRDPARETPVREGLIVSPADGVVQMIEQVAPPAELDMGPKALTRVSIFMNVFNRFINFTFFIFKSCYYYRDFFF